MSNPTRTVLITGCSFGGIGSGLARVFHARGLRVFATARNPKKMAELESLGIECIPLDVLSNESIRSCVSEITTRIANGGTLDILINNAGGGYNMPVSDIDIEKGRELFDLNVWSGIAVTQAFLPLLLKSKTGMIVNQTSVSSVCNTPFSSAYNASKAAQAMFSEHMRLELAPFGIKVVELKTGAVATNFQSNRTDEAKLPADSIYQISRDRTEAAIRAEQFSETTDLDTWSNQVVGDLLKKNPPAHIWRGKSSGSVWWAYTFSLHGVVDSMISKMTGLDVLAKKLKEQAKA